MDTLVLGHRVWHDTGGGCHSSFAPSGLVALSKEHRRWGNLLTTYSKMTWQKCPVEKVNVNVGGLALVNVSVTWVPARLGSKITPFEKVNGCPTRACTLLPVTF